MAERRNFNPRYDAAPYDGYVWSEFNGESNWFLKGKQVGQEEYEKAKPVPINIIQSCANCRFARLGYRAGSCRRHAPTTTRSWPIIQLEDWCGDWEKK